MTASLLADGLVNLQPLDKTMSLQPINVVCHRNTSITITLGVMVMLLLFSSCSGRKKEFGEAITERDSLPVMDTRGVTTLFPTLVLPATASTPKSGWCSTGSLHRIGLSKKECI